MTGENSKYGIGFNLGFEWFIHKPIGIELDYGFGFVNDAMFNDFNTKLNLYRGRIKGFLGYKYLSMGNVPMNNIIIGI